MAWDAIETLRGLANRTTGIHRKIAADTWPNGAVMRCKCGYQFKASIDEMAEFLQYGWPRHCDGINMDIFTCSPSIEYNKEKPFPNGGES